MPQVRAARGVELTTPPPRIAMETRRSRRAAARPPKRGHDALTLLVEFPQPELSCWRSLTSTAVAVAWSSLVSRHHRRTAIGVWAAEMPRQVDQRLGKAVNCISKPCSTGRCRARWRRGRYLRSRHATLRLRDVIDGDRVAVRAPWTRSSATMAHPPCRGGGRTQGHLQGADVDLRDDNARRCCIGRWCSETSRWCESSARRACRPSIDETPIARSTSRCPTRASRTC